MATGMTDERLGSGFPMRAGSYGIGADGAISTYGAPPARARNARRQARMPVRPPAMTGYRFTPWSEGWAVRRAGFLTLGRQTDIGWIFCNSDGEWVADLDNGDYLPRTYAAAEAAVNALEAERMHRKEEEEESRNE